MKVMMRNLRVLDKTEYILLSSVVYLSYSAVSSFLEMIKAGQIRWASAETDELFDYGDICDAEWDDKGRTVISHIYVSFDTILRSVQFGYLENGALVLSKKYGPSEGSYNFRVSALFIIIMEVLKVGPLGNYSDGEKWEETGLDKISHIFVTVDSSTVKSIQFGYVINGALVLSKKHGVEDRDDEDSTRFVRLNHESEFVTGISGESLYSGLSSLTFHTNEGKHLAFLAEFNSPRGRQPHTIEFHSGIRYRREIGGFFGSSNSYQLNSIGLYVRPVFSREIRFRETDV